MTITREQFEAMDDREKRLAVVGDALAQIKNGVYIVGKGLCASKVSPDQCFVCAAGAILVSIAGLNGRPLDDMWATRIYNRDFAGIVFAAEELYLIEGFFEGWPQRTNKGDLVNKWCDAYPGLTDRLRAILLNMQRHDGLLDPSDLGIAPPFMLNLPESNRIVADAQGPAYTATHVGSVPVTPSEYARMNAEAYVYESETALDGAVDRLLRKIPRPIERVSVGAEYDMLGEEEAMRFINEEMTETDYADGL